MLDDGVNGVVTGDTVLLAIDRVTGETLGATTVADAQTVALSADGTVAYVVSPGEVDRVSAIRTSTMTLINNVDAERDRIEDADFAAETALFSKSQILTQASTALLAQANQAPQQVLNLLG